jgi:hypothetical protein
MSGRHKPELRPLRRFRLQGNLHTDLVWRTNYAEKYTTEPPVRSEGWNGVGRYKAGFGELEDSDDHSE